MKKNQRLKTRKKGGGRPPKFTEPSQVITLTLPESTLRELQYVDPDRGRAIVKLAKRAVRSNGATQPLVEIVEMTPNTGLIVIGSSHVLRQIPFLQLVEVAPARYLLAVERGYDFKSLEIAIRDVVDDVPEHEKQERDLIIQLLEHIKRLRKTERVRTAEILFVTLDGKRPGRTAERGQI